MKAWVDIATQRVVRTELRYASSTRVGTQTDFEWRQELDADAPVRMRHEYGTATYDRFRRFQVTTTERIR